MNKKRAQAAAVTKKTILESACALFVRKGFEGVSISEIAKDAQVNQSLIYHHFVSKEELWKSVKNNFVEAFVNTDDLHFDTKKGLQHILRQIVRSRFDVYRKHPEILRMIGWQKLEVNKEELAGGTPFSPDNWKKAFGELQKQGEIRPEINIDLMILFISSVITGIFTEDYQKNLVSSESQQKYLDMIIECFALSFGRSESL